MNGNIRQFADAVGKHLSDISTSLNHLHALTSEQTEPSEQAIRTSLNEVGEITTDKSCTKLALLLAELNQLVEAEKPTRNQVADWKIRRLTSRLHLRADVCEQLATTSIALAALAIVMAESASVQALVARKDAISAQVQQR